MRITVATGPLLPVPALAGGAIPRMWLGLAKEFVRRGQEVNIVARSYAGQAAAETIAGVRIVRSGGFHQTRRLTLDLVRNFAYSLMLVQRLPHAEILVTNDFWTPVMAGLLKRKAGAIIVSANRFPKGQFRLYRRASRIAAASSVVAEAVSRECPALASKTRVMPNPIDTDVFRPLEGRPSELGKSLLFVGRLHPEKGVRELVEAFSRFHRSNPEWRLQLIGPWEERQGGGGAAFEKTLRRMASDLPVEFSGPIFDHNELARILQRGSLFCYPSFAGRGEALPVAPLEAMACGLPVLTSSLECFSDYIADGETGFVFDHEGVDPPAALAARLEFLAANPLLLSQVGRNAIAKASEFSYPAIAARFLEDFELLVVERR